HLQHQPTADTDGGRRADPGPHTRGHAAPDLHHTDVQLWQRDVGAVRHDHRHRDEAHHASAPFQHPAADGDGWLPPERAHLYTAPDTGTPGERGGDTAADPSREDTVTRSEITPWSRPADEPAPQHELPQPTDTSRWRVTGDPWAPPDEHLAEEYHSERATSRRTPSWQHDGADIWSTDRWRPRAKETAGDESLDDERRDADLFDASARHDTDEHLTTDEHLRGPAPMPDEVERPVLQTDASNDARFANWRHDDHMGEAAGAATNGSYRNGRHADDAPPAVTGQARDPWANAWEDPAAPDISEVWTPVFDRSWQINGNGHAAPDAQYLEPSRGDAGEIPSDALRPGDTPWSPPADNAAPSDLVPDPIQGERARRWTDDHGRSAIDAPYGDATVDGVETQDDEDHVPTRDDARGVDAPPIEPHDDLAHDVTERIADAQPSTPPVGNERSAADVAAAPHVEPAISDAPDAGRRPHVAADPAPISEDADDGAPAVRVTEVSTAPAPQPAPDPAAAQAARHERGAPVTRARPERTAATSTRRTDAPVPPPLASLRNTRRSDEWRDPMEALQSLQDQLDRLGGTGRRNRRPRRAGSGDTDRPER
ncbi:MAG TPA: hypothetical protein VK923_14385, partial [Euzebyales bacterium]|nr:hypothetical protein [Euzebyales bacterium]